MGTSFFENVVNVGFPHRGCVINAGLTQVTRVDNTLFPTRGHVAMLPSCGIQSVVNMRYPIVGRVDNALSLKGTRVDQFYMNFYDKGLKTLSFCLAGFSPCWNGRSMSMR